MKLPASRHSRLFRSVGLVALLVGSSIAGGCGVVTEPRTSVTDARTPRATASSEWAEAGGAGRCARATTNALPAALPAAVRAGSRGGGSVVLARGSSGLLAYVAREDDDAISVIDVAARRELGAIEVAGGPTQLVVLADGRVATSLRRSNEIAIFEPSADAPAAWLERCRTGVAHAEPIGLATSPDGSALYVASGWGAAVSTFGTSDLAARGSVAVAREPRALAQPTEGGPIFVSHAVGSVVSRVDVDDVHRPTGVRPIGLGVTSVSRRTNAASRFEVNQGFALVSDASRVFVPGAAVLPQSVELSSSSSGAFAEGYGGGSEMPVRPTVRVLDVVSGAPVAQGTGRAERVAPCVLPRAADLGAPGKLYVACANVDTVVELDARAPEPASYEMRRFLVPAGPTGLAVDATANVAVTWSSTHREVGVLDLERGASVAVSVSKRGTPMRTAREERGRALFRDGTEPRIGFDGRACESCHPDGRDDGLTWSTPDGPRQTIALAGRVEATDERFGWFGEHRSLEEHMRHTMRRLGGVGFERPADRADLEALMTWIRVLPVPREPADARGDETTIARGRAAFESVGCAKCHENGGADGRAHDVVTGSSIERRLAFDTPSLRGVATSAPYMHDGSFATLDALLATAKGPMGAAKSLAEADRAAIATYMRSLAPRADARAPSGPLLAPTSDALPVVRAAATGPYQKMVRGLSQGTSSGRRLEPFDLDALAIHDVDALPEAADVRYPIAPDTVALQTREVADPARDGVRYVAGRLRFERPGWGTVHVGPYLHAQAAMDPVVELTRGERFVDVSWARFDAVPGDGGKIGLQRWRRAEAYVDHERGEIAIRRRVDVVVRPVLGTSVFAYIQRCQPCVPEDRTKLVLVGRSSSPEDLSLDVVPIRRGASGSGLIVATTLDETPSWSQRERAIPRVIQTVAVEISWAENEDEPSAHAAVTR